MSMESQKDVQAFVVVGDQPVTLFPWQRLEVLTIVEGPSMTKQAFAAECDINNIMKRYEKDAVVDHLNKVQGRYGDFTGVVSYQEACNIVIKAEEMFMSIPAAIRARFDNDPGNFLAFATDDKNEEELVKLGLAHQRPKADTPPAPDNTASKNGIIAVATETV